MRGPREAQEVNEISEAKETSRGVAAFFDLDGTLMPLPSLERRLFQTLRYRQAIPARNYFLWLGQAVRLLPEGISAAFQANKMYLRGVQIFDERDKGDGNVSSRHKDGHQAEGQASVPPRRNPRLSVPSFFPEAIERITWHAKQGHEIVLVSGTLEPLAQGAARALEAELAEREIKVTIQVIATQLEEKNGRWTGRILGGAMFGEAKERAVKRFARDMRLDLERCYAYGDTLKDRWMMEAVGRPTAVNASNDLASIARKHSWSMLQWNSEKEIKKSTKTAPGGTNTSRSLRGDALVGNGS